MDKGKKINVSIIVPIYNSAKYIDELMDSILNQTFIDFELILVNDGSSDNSLELLEEWGKRDERIVIVNKKNGGVTSARNAGIDIAKGEYVWFHDHDDYAFSNTLATMYKEVGDRDFLIAGWKKAKERNKAKSILRNDTVSKRVIANNLQEMKEKLPFSGWIGVIWRCLFKQSVLKDNNIRFKSINHEDTLFIYEYLSHCSSCAKIDFEGYVFMDTPNSLGSSHKYNVDERWLDMAKTAAISCFRRFEIDDTSPWNKTLHILYTPHCGSFVTTGYHQDSKLSFKERIVRWRYLSHNSFWKETNKFGFHSRFQHILWVLCHCKLYYLADPFLLLFTRIHDHIKHH